MTIIVDSTIIGNSQERNFSQSSHNSTNLTDSYAFLSLHALQAALNCIGFAKFKAIGKIRIIGNKAKTLNRKALKRLLKFLKGTETPTQEAKGFLENYVEDHHRLEFEKSSVDPALVGVNILSVEGDGVFDYLAVDPNIKRNNRGGLETSFLKRYAFATKGLWRGCTLNTVTGELDDYTVIKTDILNSYIDKKTGKQVTNKYQNPQGVKAIPTFPLITLQIWKKIAKRYAVSLPVIADLHSLEPLDLTKLFLRWIQSNKSIPVFIVEGYKKALAALSKGVVVIGICSMNTGATAAIKDENGNITKPAELRPQIVALGLQDRQIYIALDEDAKQATKHNVVRQTSKLGNLLEAQGSKVAILNWKAHQGKGLDDYIANGFDFELLIRDAQPLEIWESKVIKFESDNKWLDGLALNRWLKHQDYTPDIINNKQRFSFPEDLPVKGHLIGVDGYMGMGKTHTQLQLISQRQKKGIYAYVISPRRKLNNQTVARGFKDFQLTIYRLNDDDGTDLLPSKSITITLCPESLAKLDGYFEGMDLWIDEVETVLPQMLAGGTLKGKRQALTLEILKKAVSQCNNCYLLDAFLTDKTVSFFASLAEEKKVIKFGNIYQPERPQPAIIVDVVEDEKIKVHDKSVVSQILIGHKRPFIGTDSQTYAQALDLVFKTVGKVGFVLDSTSNNQTWLELFETKPELELRFKHLLVENNIPVGEFWVDRLMSNPDNFFTILNPDYFVYTTTAESGVSVDLTDHFDCRALIVFGVIGTNSQLQLSGRLRDNLIPFYIYCPERSVIPQLDGFNAQKQELLKANIDSLFEEQRGLLGNSNLEICFDLAFKRMKKLNIFWEHGTYLAALANFEKANLRGCLIYKLRLMGYEIEYKNEESIKGMKDALKKAKQAVQENETLLLFNSKPFESLEEAEKVKKANPSAKTARRAKMTKILHNLPGINETPIWSVEFLLKCFTKDRNFYYNLNTYFLLFNPDIDCKNSDYSRYFRYTCEFIAQTTLLKDLGVTLSGLRKLGIDVLIQKLVKGLEIHSNSLEVIDCVKLARNRKDIKRLAGFRITPETEEKAENIKYIKTQLAKVGVFLKESGQKLDKGGVKRKWYSIDFDKFYSEYRLTSLKCIKKYFDIWKLEKYEANKPDWEYSAANNGERSPMITDSNQEESGTNKNYRERVTEITQGVPPVVNVDQWQQELQNRTKEEKINYVTFCLPQIVDGFTLLNDHIQVLPVVKQMVAGKAIQCVDSVKILATEFYDALRNSRDLRRVIFDFDCVLIDDLECELIGTY